MRPERLEELRGLAKFTAQSDAQDFHWVTELFAEIDRLTIELSTTDMALDQAIKFASLRVRHAGDDMAPTDDHNYVTSWLWPELAVKIEQKTSGGEN